MMTSTSESRLRNTTQEDLELNPAAHDSSANENLDEMGLRTATLFRQALEQTRMAITIVDPHQADTPIVYANRAFTELTGFELEDSLGRNCRFLQGPDTDPSAVDQIRDAMKAQEVRVVEMLNYRKDGSTFWNSLHIGPIYDDAGKLTHYYGSQWDVTDLVAKRARIALQTEVAEELQHRTKNLFAVISAIVSLSARGESDTQQLVSKIRARLSALNEAHMISISEGRTAGQSSDLYDLISAILRPYGSDGDTDSIILSGPIVQVPRDAVTPVGLMIHEMATNALKHGALGSEAGTVTITWRRRDGRLHLTWTEEGGPETTSPSTSGTGSRMMEGVLRTVGATVKYDWPPSGLIATLDLDLS